MPDTDIRKVLRLVFAVAAVAAAALSRIAIAFRYPLDMDHINHALWFRDIVENHNYLMANWYVVKNHGLFTEVLPVQFVLGAIIGMNEFSVRLGAVLVFALVCAMLFAVLRRTYGSGAAFWGSVALIASPVAMSKYYLMPNFHAGTYAFALLCFWLLLRIVEDGPAKLNRSFVLRALALAALTVTTVFSDYLFGVIFTAPAVMAMLSMRFLFRSPVMAGKREAVLIAALAVSAAAGVALNSSTEAFGLHLTFAAPTEMVPMTADGIRAAIHQGVKHLAGYYKLGFMRPGPGMAERVIGLVNFLIAATVCLHAVLIILREKDPRRKLSGLFFVSAAALLFSAYVARKYVHAWYLAPLLFMYASMLAAAVARSSMIRSRWLRTALLALLVLSAGYNIYEGAAYEKRDVPQAGLAGFLVENGLKYGYAFISDCNLTTFLADGKVKLRPVRFDKFTIEPDIFHVNMDWYDYKQYTGPTFLVVSEDRRDRGFGKLTPALLRQMFGRPTRQLRYGNADIYEWNYNIIQTYWINRAMSEMKKPQR